MAPTIWTSGGEGKGMLTRAYIQKTFEQKLCLTCGRELGEDWKPWGLCEACKSKAEATGLKTA